MVEEAGYLKWFWTKIKWRRTASTLWVLVKWSKHNSSSPSASFVNQDEEYLITTGKFLTSADDVETWLWVWIKIGLFIWDKLLRSGWTFNGQKLCVFGYGKQMTTIKCAIWISRGYHIRWKSKERMQWKLEKFLKK
jgi:hypothetical protein